MTNTAEVHDTPADSADGAALLTVDDLVKTFSGEKQRRRRRAGAAPRVHALAGVSFDVRPGELFTLLGPSGCGKTTTLRSIAGLERPDDGTISVGDRVLYDKERGISVPSNARRLGMVFQSYAIWPHMTVFANAAFPLEVLPRRRRPGRAALDERVRKVLERVELGDYADRPATKLSGGQQQRLALARALVMEPQLLLLDEPLSNLDAKLRESMRFELKRMQRELGLTAIYVTHDQSEALALSSRIAVMQAGRIVQIGKPREVYERPNCQFVADFIGVTNFVPGTVAAHGDGRYRVRTSDGDLWVTSDLDLAVGTEVTLSVRPECVALSLEPGSSAVNEWHGRVVNRAFLGDSVDHVVGIGKIELRNRSNPAQSIAPGTDVYLTIDPDKIALVAAGE
ncbi:MAG TPA: ABC transporter ATP-binding protein [Streptosporangiaceae bacterium]|jgi:iron(III) transport system ATP-binding protein